MKRSTRVRFVRRRVLDFGCGQCDDLLSYVVLAAGDSSAPFRERRSHFGVNWVAFDADGHMVSGSDGTGETGLVAQFRTRRLAGEALARADAAREEDTDG